MPETILEFAIDTGDSTVELPKGAQILGVQARGAGQVLLVRADPEALAEQREFKLIPLRNFWRVTSVSLPGRGICDLYEMPRAAHVPEFSDTAEGDEGASLGPIGPR